jgi:urease accessory protein UreF
MNTELCEKHDQYCQRHEALGANHELRIEALESGHSSNKIAINALAQSVESLHKKQDNQTTMIQPATVGAVVSALYAIWQIVQGFFHG